MNKKIVIYTPIVFITICIIFILNLLWFYWPQILVLSHHWQYDIYQKLAEMFYQGNQQITKATFYFIMFSFIYGLLHSLGPGHGKFIVSSYLLTHPSRYKSSLYLTVCGAFLQAITAITLVLVGKYIFSKSMRSINHQAHDLTSFSFYFIIALGMFMLLQIVYFYYKDDKEAAERCSCCSHHQPLGEIPYNHSISMVLSIGLRPCTGALMVLLLASTVGSYWLGVVSALMMAFGTAITTSIVAWCTISGKKIVNFYSIKKEKEKKSIINFPLLFKIILALFFILLGCILLKSQPTQMQRLF